VDVIKIDLPYPATRQNLIDAYDQALSKNPHIRMMVLTHISHRDGLRLPVDEILNLARARGIDVLVDCAHAWGQQSIDLRSMGIEFAAFNLHKWLGAPIGVGAVFIAKSRIQDIAPFMGQSEREADPIDARIHTGTVNFAAQMAAIDALDFHTQLGSDRCGARFSYLRDYWVQHVRDVPRIEILTPDDPSLHAGITSFRLAGENSRAANIALAEQLRKQHKIVTVMREGLASGACLRITPGYSTNVEDMNVLIKALRTL
jgi:selenocysteine lyase/cysteine desulfurase